MTRTVIQMTIDDAAHYSPAQRAAIIASYPEHEREARVMGIPSVGSGRVFQVPESDIVIDPISIPSHWPQINGLDFGYDHPFAAVNCAWDRDADIFYLCKEYAARESTPIIHAAAIRPWGAWIPCAWPHDGLQHDKGSGIELRRQYADQSLNMLQDKAEFEGGGFGVEAGIMDMLDRMQTGRFKVFRTLTGWIEEFRMYHRLDGLIVKERDDRISASRYGLMMKRFAITRPNGESIKRKISGYA